MPRLSKPPSARSPDQDPTFCESGFTVAFSRAKARGPRQHQHPNTFFRDGLDAPASSTTDDFASARELMDWTVAHTRGDGAFLEASLKASNPALVLHHSCEDAADSGCWRTKNKCIRMRKQHPRTMMESTPNIRKICNFAMAWGEDPESFTPTPP